MDSEDPFKWPDDWKKAIHNVYRGVRSHCGQNWLQEADTEDVFAEVMIWLCRAVEGPKKEKYAALTFPTVRKFVNFCITIAHYIILKRRLADARRKESAAVDVDNIPVEFCEYYDVRKVAEIIAPIEDESVRRALQLRYEENLQFRQVAQALGVSVGKAHKLVAIGLEALREIEQ